MNNLEKCELILRALGNRAPNIQADELEKHFLGWELIDVGGAIVMLKDNEMHVAAEPSMSGKWFKKSVIRLMQDVINKHGSIKTVSMKDHKIGRDFAKRLGFQEVEECGETIRYELRKLKYAL